MVLDGVVVLDTPNWTETDVASLIGWWLRLGEKIWRKQEVHK